MQAKHFWTGKDRENLTLMWWQHSGSLCLPNDVELRSYSRIDAQTKVERMIISHHPASIALYIIQGGGP